MPRVPEFDQTTMSDAQRQAVQEIVNGPHGRIVGPYHAWLHSPELARRGRNVSEYLRFKGILPKRLMELVILVTGRHWRAEFEYWAHARLAKEAGVDEAVIAAIARNERPRLKQADEKLVYAVAKELFDTNRVSEKTYRAAVGAFGLQAVVELIATIGWYCMVSLTLNTFEIAMPPGEKSPFLDKRKAPAAKRRVFRTRARKRGRTEKRRR
jgi:4-carboxymuconolactone decarboxylase